MNKNTSNRCISAAFAVVIAVVMFLSTTISVSAVSEDYTEPSASVNQTQEHHTIDTAAMDAEREAASRASEERLADTWSQILGAVSEDRAQAEETASEQEAEFNAKMQEVQEFSDTVEPIAMQGAEIIKNPVVSGMLSLAGSVWGILFLIFIGILFSILTVILRFGVLRLLRQRADNKKDKKEKDSEQSSEKDASKAPSQKSSPRTESQKDEDLAAASVILDEPEAFTGDSGTLDCNI